MFIRGIYSIIRAFVRGNYFSVIFYTVFFLSILLIIYGQPKSIFRSHLHFPWLTNVEHVQPLKCLSDDKQPDWPRPFQLETKPDNNLTVVIVTARPEFKRLPATLAALICHLDYRRLTEVIFLVPPRDVKLLEPYLSPKQAQYYPWHVRILSDDILLKHIHTNSYRLQMMFKLVLAQIIQTEYYLILDSDCLALWPIHTEQLLYKENSNSSSYKAVYQIEGKSGHETWWSESEELLQMKLEVCLSTNSSSSAATMGVTPSILSRTIALRTLCRLQKLYGDERFLNKMANWALWRLIAGRMWTEYTLYFLTARCTKIFDQYHFHYNTLPASHSLPKLNLYGLSIWSLGDWTAKNQNQLVESIRMGLKWREKEIKEANGQAIIDKSMDTHSLFSVLQGRHDVDPKFYHQLFFPLYIQYLQQQNQTQQLIKILNYMSEQLTAE